MKNADELKKYVERELGDGYTIEKANMANSGMNCGNAVYRRPNQRWFEVEISADNDYNEEARSRYAQLHPNMSREEIDANMKGDIPERIPEDGFYNFKTNSNANPKQSWYIAGSIKIGRPLSEAEARRLAEEAGVEPDLPYKDGIKDFDEEPDGDGPGGGVRLSVNIASNGKESRLDERQYREVRTPQFKAWAGDWDRNYQKGFLFNREPVSQLTGNEFSRIAGKTLTEQVGDYFNSIGNKAVSPILGEVVLDERGAEDSLAHGMGRNKAIAYAAVKDVIENGILVDSHINHKGRGYNTAILAEPIEIGGERYACLVAVRRSTKTNRFYLHEVTAEKNLLDGVFVTNLAQKPTPSGDIAKVLQEIVTAKESTKVVDENGEPLVMYHTTPNEFTVFDKNRINTSGHGKYIGYGFNFASHQTSYGDNVMKVYLDAKKPLRSNALTLSEEQVAGILKKLGYRIARPNMSQTYDEQLREFVHNELRYYGGSDADIYQWISNFSFDANDVMRSFEELGYDSSIVYGFADDKIKTAVVFRPEQIKSATENNGEFSRENPDIRFSVSEDRARRLSQRERDYTAKVIKNLRGAGVRVQMATDEEAKSVLDAADQVNREMMLGWHGSAADFDAFDHSHMGEGEGAQAYGWGTYITSVKGIGVRYAKMKGSNGKKSNLMSLFMAAHMSGKLLPIHYKGKPVPTVSENNRTKEMGEAEHIVGQTMFSNIGMDAETAIARAKEYHPELTKEFDALDPNDFEIKWGNGNFLYRVEIPDNDGTNFLPYDEPLTEEMVSRIKSGIEEKIRLYNEGKLKVKNYQRLELALDRMSIPNVNGAKVITELGGALGKRGASEFLSECGFIGTEYPAEFRTGGRKDNAKNYVIFNEANAKIVNKTELLKTSDGTVYGWHDKDGIHLTKAGLNPNTPMHEYTHGLMAMLKEREPEKYQRIVDGLKESDVWQEVMGDELYSNIRDDMDAVASEVASRLSGSESETRANETMPEKVKRVLQELWDAVAEWFGAKSGKAIPADRVARMTLRELQKGTNPDATESVNAEMMGSRVNKRMAEIGSKLAGKVMTKEQQALVDVFSGKSTGEEINITKSDGSNTILVVQKGKEPTDGAAHSVFRHYNTRSNYYTADELFHILDMVKGSAKTPVTLGNGRPGFAYTETIDGVRFRVLTEVKDGKEFFNNFLTNRKAAVSPSYMPEGDTPEGAQWNETDAYFTGKGTEDSGDVQENDAKLSVSLGAPYQGSKGRIADKVVDKLPRGKRFVDLFSGGGAVTHAAMLSGKYGTYRMNDINPAGQDLFLQGMRGEWRDYKPEDMTPEEFAKIKGTAKGLVLSYGGLGRNMDYDKESVARRVRRVQRLEELKGHADKVDASNTDYRDVELQPGDVVYADIPYSGTDQYGYGKGKFDKAEFSEWGLQQDVPVYVSEQSMPDCWVEVASWDMANMRGKTRGEKLFVQEKFADGRGKNRGIDNAGIRFSVSDEVYGYEPQGGGRAQRAMLQRLLDTAAENSEKVAARKTALRELNGQAGALRKAMSKQGQSGSATHGAN